MSESIPTAAFPVVVPDQNFSPHTMRLAAKVEELANLGHGIRRIAANIDRHPERVRQLMKINREENQ